MTDPRIVPLADGRLMIEAPAKLNLGLRIFPPRPDGFHDLESWMVPLSWHDTLWVEPADQLTLEIAGRAEGVPANIEKNLVGKAALKLAAAAGCAPRGRIVLHKILPPGGGLGGGSSDAASVLVALNELWNAKFDRARLEKLAADLGSDVPLFVRGQASLCTGRGEVMTPLRGTKAPLFAVLLLPPFGCPTKEVYQAFDAGLAAGTLPAHPKTDWQQLASSSAADLNRLLLNDLAEPAFRVAPPLRQLRDHAAAIAKQPLHVTGSGSTLYTLCDSGSAANALRDTLETALGDSCVCVGAQVLI
jgi:4-diphosphocytidyl-2-C-methyl-D-erythritol kinase